MKPTQTVELEWNKVESDCEVLPKEIIGKDIIIEFAPFYDEPTEKQYFVCKYDGQPLDEIADPKICAWAIINLPKSSQKLISFIEAVKTVILGGQVKAQSNPYIFDLKNLPDMLSMYQEFKFIIKKYPPKQKIPDNLLKFKNDITNSLANTPIGSECLFSANQILEKLKPLLEQYADE